jgi:cyclic pyranopterin phosphate synthase
MSAATADVVVASIADAAWSACQFLTCSILPVRQACNLDCPFCFSKSSVSALGTEAARWDTMDIDRYYAFARERGAARLVITGGGEPLLRPEVTLKLIRQGRRWFDEIACFTNGSISRADWRTRCRTRAFRISAIPAITTTTACAGH